MNFDWQFVIDLGLLGFALMAATWIRLKIRFFQRFLIPNSLTAGFMLFPFYNWVLPRIGMGTANLENIVYHFLGISFIAMTLRVSHGKRRSSRDVFATSTMVLSQYAIQSFLGTAIVLALIYFGRWINFDTFSELFPGFGLFATLGFSQGPGQAFGFGKNWEAMGFDGMASVGLSFGAIGFVFASFGGIFLINYGLRKGLFSKSETKKLDNGTVRAGMLHRGESVNASQVTDITNPEAIDPFSFSAGLVLATYLLTYLILTGLTTLLQSFGSDKLDLFASSLWNIIFIFAALTAMLVKEILKALHIEYIIDNQRMTRITGFSVDFMVAAAIAAISAAVVAQYWIPISIVAALVGLATTVSHIWLSSRIFQDHVFYRTILIYGVVTGTMPTGLALLRIIDPHFETPASRDFMYAASITFVFAIPILLTANMPAMGALRGTLAPTFTTLAIYALYVLGCFVVYLFLSGRRRFADPSVIWLKREL